MSSIVLQHRDTIIKRMERGDRLTDIANDLGLTSHAAISMRLSKDPEYQAARIASLASRLDQREEEMEAANDSVTIARTRELLSHARWRAEREAPQVWGVKQETVVTHKTDVSEALNDARKALQARKVSTTYSVDTIEDAQIVGDSTDKRD